jgi:hypothetical protein
MALEAISKKYKLSHLPLIVEKLNIENFWKMVRISYSHYDS